MKKAQNGKRSEADAEAASRVVGRVTPKERDEIQALYERKNGLNELVLSLQGSELLANELFYEKVVADLGRTTTRFTEWWTRKAKAYGWEDVPGFRWSIDFENCEIILARQGSTGRGISCGGDLCHEKEN